MYGVKQKVGKPPGLNANLLELNQIHCVSYYHTWSLKYEDLCNILVAITSKRESTEHEGKDMRKKIDRRSPTVDMKRDREAKSWEIFNKWAVKDSKQSRTGCCIEARESTL